MGQRLRLAFEFDPRWRVGLWEGQPVAWARQADSAGWSAPWGGYRQVDALTIRSMFRFAPRPSDHPWSASGLVARNEAGTRAMQVMAWKVDRGAWLNQHAAAFTIDGNGLSLEVHEISSNLTLTGTQNALRQASLRTKAIADQVEREHLQRTGLAMVPPGEPRIGNPFVEVRSIDGTLDLRGAESTRAPPAGSGCGCSMKAVGPGTKQPSLSPQRSAWAGTPTHRSCRTSRCHPRCDRRPDHRRRRSLVPTRRQRRRKNLGSFPFPSP